MADTVKKKSSSTKKRAAKGGAVKKRRPTPHTPDGGGGDSLRSTARRPDLDWSQIRETVMMLGLAVAQIESSMSDGHESVDVLGNSFTSMYGAVQTIAMAADSLPDRGDSGRAKRAIEENCAQVSARMQEVIVAMQFYDKLTQRLSHVAHSIEALADLVADSGRLYNPFEWAGLQEKIRSKYTIEEERVMFDAIMAGATVEEALEEARRLRARRAAQRPPSEDGESVDLF